MKNNRHSLFYFLPLLMMAVQACAPSGSGNAAEPNPTAAVEDASNTQAPADEEKIQALPDTAEEDPQNLSEDLATDDQETGDSETSAAAATTAPSILLFNGIGISTSDWQNTERIVKSMGLTYKLVNSSQLNAMTLDQIAKFKMILVPGGHAGGITSGLKSSTRLKVRQAVRDLGVSYLGICAGAFVAVERGANTNQLTSYGFPVIEGSHLPVWWPNGDTSKVAAIATVSFADGSKRRLVWWGGPSTPEWKGGVIARYANGKPAMSQAWSGKGFVVLSGPHPEAPQGWRATAGYDSDGLDYEIAKKLILAALNRSPLPAYK